MLVPLKKLWLAATASARNAASIMAPEANARVEYRQLPLPQAAC
jgi:hypothetical protein